MSDPTLGETLNQPGLNRTAALHAVLDLPPCAGPDDLYQNGYNTALKTVHQTIATTLGIPLSSTNEPNVT